MLLLSYTYRTMGAEEWMLRKIDKDRQKREELSPALAKAHQKAVETLTDPDYSIQEDDFKEVYGPALVERTRRECAS